MSDAQAACPPLAADVVCVREQGEAVRALYDRGLTWVSVDPLAELA